MSGSGGCGRQKVQIPSPAVSPANDGIRRCEKIEPTGSHLSFTI
jgi:hypothetical protein